MFDTDYISFVINNSETCIIYNYHTQFVGYIEVQSCPVETSVVVGTAWYVGTTHIILSGDDVESNTYDVSRNIYDPDSPFNIIVIPYLVDFFRKNYSIPNSDDDGKK